MSFFYKAKNLLRDISEMTRQKVPRSVRVKVQKLHRIIYNSNENQKQIGVGNISIGGMGLIGQDLPHAHKGQQLSGNLLIGSDSFFVRSIIRHAGRQILGCEFSEKPANLKEAIENYFRYEIVGLSLVPIDKAYLTKDPRGEVSWYTDGRQNELFYITDQKGLVQFHMSFFGFYLEGERAKRLKAGHVVEDNKRNIGVKGSSMIKLGTVDLPEVTSYSQTIVQNLDGIQDAHRDQLLQAFTQYELK